METLLDTRQLFVALDKDGEALVLYSLNKSNGAFCVWTNRENAVKFISGLTSGEYIIYDVNIEALLHRLIESPTSILTINPE